MPTSAMKNTQNPLLKAFGRRLVELRREAGITQEDLAGTSGFDRTYISGLENAKRNPTLTALSKLADALGIPIKELVDFETQA